MKMKSTLKQNSHSFQSHFGYSFMRCRSRSSISFSVMAGGLYFDFFSYSPNDRMRRSTLRRASNKNYDLSFKQLFLENINYPQRIKNNVTNYPFTFSLIKEGGIEELVLNRRLVKY